MIMQTHKQTELRTGYPQTFPQRPGRSAAPAFLSIGIDQRDTIPLIPRRYSHVSRQLRAIRRLFIEDGLTDWQCLALYIMGLSVA